MADFRKLLLALIAGALLFTTVASAVPFACRATAEPTLTRSEGIAEPMGDVLLTCTGDPPPGGIVVNVRLRLTTNITSNPISSGSNINEAALILNEGLTAFSGSGRDFIGYAASDYTTPQNNGTQNVYVARRIADDEIEWPGVMLYSGTGSQPFTTVRLTNVRGNVQARGDYATIFATVNISPSTLVTVDNNNLVVADTRPGLIFSVSSLSLKNCDTSWGSFSLIFKEGFSNAFEKQGTAATENRVPGGGHLNESMWNPGSYLDIGYVPSIIGQADQGTRLMSRLKNIPSSGLGLSVPKTITLGDGMVANAVTGTDSSGAGGTVQSGAGSVSVTGGLVVYEITASPSTAFYTQDTVTVPVTTTFTSTPGPVTAPPVTANGNFAPISTVVVMSWTAPEPRFIDRATDSTILTVSRCRTILLFPYIVQQGLSFDTGLVIANTSMDNLGTTNQSGACTLNYFGQTNASTGPAVQTSPTIGAGGSLIFALSSGGGVFAQNGGYTPCATGNCIAQLFTGYMIASCEFQFAHGYAYISDYGSKTLAQGYLALVIPDRGSSSGSRLPQDSSVGGLINHGEQLGN